MYYLKYSIFHYRDFSFFPHSLAKLPITLSNIAPKTKKIKKIKPTSNKLKKIIILIKPKIIITSEIKVINGPTKPLVNVSKSAVNLVIRLDGLFFKRKHNFEINIFLIFFEKDLFQFLNKLILKVKIKKNECILYQKNNKKYNQKIIYILRAKILIFKMK